jgi:hypothetical protein
VECIKNGREKMSTSWSDNLNVCASLEEIWLSGMILLKWMLRKFCWGVVVLLNLAEASDQWQGVTRIVVGYYRRLPKEAGEF